MSLVTHEGGPVASIKDMKGRTVTAMAYADSGFYALLGMSFGVIYQTSKIFHLANAIPFAAAGYTAVWTAEVLHFPFFVALLAGLSLGAGAATAHKHAGAHHQGAHAATAHTATHAHAPASSHSSGQPVVKHTTWAPPAIWPVADTGSYPGESMITRPRVVGREIGRAHV